MKNLTKKSILITVVTVILAMFTFSVSAADNAVYVNQGSSGNGTKDNPFGNIEQAIAALGGKDGTIYISGQYDMTEFDYAPGWEGMITFAPADSSSVLKASDYKYFILRGDATFRGFNFDFGSNSHMNSVGSKLIVDFGEDCVFDHWIHIGMFEDGIAEKQELIYESGYTDSVYAGGAYSYSHASGITGNNNITVNGGHINHLYLCADLYSGEQSPMSIGGNMNVVINGGIIDNVTYLQSNKNYIYGALNIVFNNGLFPTTSFIYPDNALGGTYIVKSQEGGIVTPTEEIGVFDIKADAGKVAKIDFNLVFDGKIKLEPGTTNVEWVDTPVENFLSNATKIIFELENDEVIVNGVSKTIDVPPMYLNGEVLVPARAIADLFNVDVSLNGNTDIITINGNNKTIRLALDSNFIYCDGVSETINVPAQSIQGITMLPVRAISEALEYTVTYNTANKKLIAEKTTGLYVKQGSSGNGTPDNPFGTIQEAILALNGKDGTIFIDGRYDMTQFDYYSGWEGMITLAPVNSDSILAISDSKAMVFRGDVTIKGFNFELGQNVHANSIGSKLVMDLGDDVIYNGWVHIGAYGDMIVEEQELIIESGYIDTIFTGGAYTNKISSGVAGDIDVIINGGLIENILLNADLYASEQVGMSVGGNMNLVVNGGSIGNIGFIANYLNTIHGALNIIFNNGIAPPTKFSYPQHALGGTYIIKSKKGGMITPSEDTGIFNVIPDADMVCKINGKLVYDDTIRLEPGVTEVDWVVIAAETSHDTFSDISTETPSEISKVTYTDSHSASKIIFEIGKNQVTVDGVTKAAYVPAMYLNDGILVNATIMAQAIGTDFIWFGNKDTIAFKKNGINIKFMLNQKQYSCDGVVKKPGVPAMILDGRTMVPMYELAETFGYSIRYDTQNQTVILTKNTIFVKQGSSGTGTADAPLGTIQDAILALDGQDGTIYICGEYDLTMFDHYAGWNGMITLAPADQNTILTMDNSKSAVFRGDVTIKDFNFDFGTDTHINSVGSKLVMDLGNHGTYNYWVHIGAYGDMIVENQEYVHESGYAEVLYTGGAYTSSSEYGVTGDVDVTINGGHIEHLYLNADLYGNLVGMTIGGNKNIVINSGTIGQISFIETNLNQIKGALNIVFNNGIQPPTKFSYPEIALGGTYIVKSEKGGMITPTEEIGVFNVKADDGKVAKINDTLVYDGTVTLEPGETEVLWVDNTIENDVIYTGICGANLIWTYSNGTLLISGTGEMTNWHDFNVTPWYFCRSSIKSVTIKNGVTSIGSYAFSDCENLTYISLPDTITSIGHWAFTRCNRLPFIDIPDSVTSVGEGAFSYCNSLTNIDIPDSVILVGENAFFYCENLQTATIGKNMASIEIGAFDGCEKLISITVNEENKSYSSDSDGVLFNKDKTILIRCPEGKTGSYTIPGSVSYISRFAFYDCANIREVVIPNCVNVIEWRTFAGCTSLKDINIPDSVTYIAAEAFLGCSAITDINIPESVTAIEYNAFYNCSKLESITIPTSVTCIGYWAFSGCPSLTIYGYPKSYVETYAQNCNIDFADVRNTVASGKCGENLTWTLYDNGELIISGNGAMPEWDTEADIPWSSFKNSIKTVTIPDTVTYICEPSFIGYGDLAIKSYPNSTAQIYADKNSIQFIDSREIVASGICGKKLEWILYNTGELVISGEGAMAEWESYKSPWFEYRSLITTVTLPERITVISDYAFAFCNNITDIKLPEKVTSVGNYTFAYCNRLANVDILKNATYIGDFAFFACYDLSIHGHSGSYAHTYAAENNIPFIAKFIPGDVTADGKVNRMDLLRLGKHFTGWEVEIDMNASDVTGDGKVNRMDLLRLGKHFTGWEVELGK